MVAHFRMAAALTLAALTLPVGASAAEEMRPVVTGSTTERFSINLPVPKGYCSLDPSHAADASVIKYWQQRPAGQQLVKAAVECAQLDAWRKPPLLLMDFTEYQVVYRFDYEGMRYDQRMGLPALACQFARQQTGQPVGESRASIESRLREALAALKAGQSTMLGVIDEETSACYLLGVSRVQTSAGAPASVLRVRTTTAIKGRVLEIHHVAHTSPGKELAALHRFTDTMKRTIQLHMSANE